MSLTTILNLVFLAVGLILTIIYLIGKKERREDRFVKDPVCGNEVQIRTAEYCSLFEETIYYFDSEECRDKFKNDPEEYIEQNGI